MEVCWWPALLFCFVRYFMLYVCKRTRFSYKFYVAVLLAMAVVVRGLLLLLFSLNESQHSHTSFTILSGSYFFLCSFCVLWRNVRWCRLTRAIFTTIPIKFYIGLLREIWWQMRIGLICLQVWSIERPRRQANYSTRSVIEVDWHTVIRLSKKSVKHWLWRGQSNSNAIKRKQNHHAYCTYRAWRQIITFCFPVSLSLWSILCNNWIKHLHLIRSSTVVK